MEDPASDKRARTENNTCDVVTLDVGGTLFRVSGTTLQRAPLFEVLLRHHQLMGTFDSMRTADGAIFVDRSPELFAEVLQFLRAGEIPAPPEWKRARLQAEFKFFGLDPDTILHPVERGLQTCGVAFYLLRKGGYKKMMLERQGLRPTALGAYPGSASIGHALVASGGKLYVVGGFSPCFYPSEAYAYDLVAHTWTELANPRMQRRNAIAAAFNGKIYVMGGTEHSEGNGESSSLCDVEIFDPVTDEWHDGPSMPKPGGNAGFTLLGGRLFVVGGSTGCSGGDTPQECKQSEEALGSVLMFDPMLEKWSELPSLPEPRTAPVVFGIYGILYVLGGMGLPVGEKQFQACPNIWTLNIWAGEQSWRVQEPLQEPVSHGKAFGLGQGLVVVAGAGVNVDWALKVDPPRNGVPGKVVVLEGMWRKSKLNLADDHGCPSLSVTYEAPECLD